MTTSGTPNPEDIPRANIVGPIGQEQKQIPPNLSAFQSYMQQTEPNPMLSPNVGQMSPFDLAHGQVPPAGPTITTLIAQTNTAQGSLGDLSNQLNTPNLKVKPSTKYILKNKLTSANAHIHSASAKVGAKEVEAQKVPDGAGPIQKYLALVTDGQNQLQAAQDQLSGLAAKGENLSPADMLLVQIKLNKAQQEIEYSSILLSKAVDDMKMLMNVQL